MTTGVCFRRAHVCPGKAESDGSLHPRDCREHPVIRFAVACPGAWYALPSVPVTTRGTASDVGDVDSCVSTASSPLRRATAFPAESSGSLPMHFATGRQIGPAKDPPARAGGSPQGRGPRRPTGSIGGVGGKSRALSTSGDGRLARLPAWPWTSANRSRVRVPTNPGARTGPVRLTMTRARGWPPSGFARTSPSQVAGFTRRPIPQTSRSCATPGGSSSQALGSFAERICDRGQGRPTAERRVRVKKRYVKPTIESFSEEQMKEMIAAGASVCVCNGGPVT